MTRQLPFFDRSSTLAALPPSRAVQAIVDTVLAGIDLEKQPARLAPPLPGGEFLLMPAYSSTYVGIKVLTVAPENPQRGKEKIQGIYVLHSSADLTPVAIIDGASLTAIRTPAVTLAAIRRLADIAPAGDELPAQPRVLVYGAGTQAQATLTTAQTVFPDADVEVVSRSAAGIDRLRRQLDGQNAFTDRSADATEAVRTADIIICTTTSSEPLFDGTLVRPGAIVAAIGTHELHVRELDDTLIRRADVVVESRASAERENGNLVGSFAANQWGSGSPANLSELFGGRMHRTPGRPAVYTGVGEAWQDLACATVVYAEGVPDGPSAA